MTRRSLLLIRHGESTWNAVRRWQGRADPPLTERGEAQATAAAVSLSGLGSFDGVVTSTLRRAQRTGDLIAAGLGLGITGRIDELSERSAGEWEGLTRVEIEERYPGFLNAGGRPPGYEPDGDVVRRATSALLALAAGSARGHTAADAADPASPRASPQARTGALVVVTHGGVINALERCAEENWRRLGNLEGRWFDVDAAHGVAAPVGDRVRLIADGSPRSTEEQTDRGYA